MRLIVPPSIFFGKRVGLLVAFETIVLFVGLAFAMHFKNTGAIWNQPENVLLLLLRIVSVPVHAWLIWIWLVRPCREFDKYSDAIQSDHHFIAWCTLIICTVLFAITPICIDTGVVNRMVERTHYPRSVLARGYDFMATGSGRGLARASRYPAVGLLFANAKNDNVERVGGLGGARGGGATCFVEHVGWLQHRWISNVHGCNKTVEHIELRELQSLSGPISGVVGLQCIHGESASTLPDQMSVDSRCPHIDNREGGKVLIYSDSSREPMASLPFPSDYWFDPSVISIPPDYDRVLVRDSRMPYLLFLWNARLKKWSALKISEAIHMMRNLYLLSDDENGVVGCSAYLGGCERLRIVDLQ